MSQRRRSLPRVPASAPREVRQMMQALAEVVETGEGVRGDPLDRKVTVRDLLDGEIADLEGKAKADHPGALKRRDSDLGELDTSTPPAPSGLEAEGRHYARVRLRWDDPDEAFDNHAYTNVYRSDEDDFETAERVGRSLGDYHDDDVASTDGDGDMELAGYYYWITFTSRAGIEGPPNAEEGTYAETLEPDLAPPPTPTNVAATGAYFGRIKLSWDIPSTHDGEDTEYANHAHANIYRNTQDDFDTASLVGRSISRGYTDEVRDDAIDPDSDDPLDVPEYYYWVTFTSREDIEGDRSASVSAEPLLDTEYMLEVLTGEITKDVLASELTSEIDKIQEVDKIDPLIEDFDDAMDRIGDLADGTGDFGDLDQKVIDQREEIDDGMAQAILGADSFSDAGGSYSSIRSALVSEVDDNIAGALTDYYTKTDTDSAISGMEQDIIARYEGDDSSSGILEDYETVSDAEDARASLESSLTSAYEDHVANVLQDYETASDAESARSSLESSLTSAYEDHVANVLQDYETASDAESARSSLESSLTSAYEDHVANVLQDYETASDAESARANLESSLTSAYEDHVASVVSDYETTADAESARASLENTLQTEIGAVQVLAETVSQSSSFIRNGNFVEGDEGWDLVGDWSLEDGDDSDPTDKILMSDPADYTSRLESKPMPIIGSNEKYRMSFEVRGHGIPTDDSLTARIRFLDHNGDYLDDKTETFDVEGSDWKKHVLYAEAPKEAEKAQAAFERPSDASDKVYITNISGYRVDARGDEAADIAESIFVAKVQANGLVGGFGLYNDSEEVEAAFDVDRFWIGRADDDKVLPFIVDDDTVYMDEARIREAAIDTLKIAGNAVTLPEVAQDSSVISLSSSYSEIISKNITNDTDEAIDVTVTVTGRNGTIDSSENDDSIFAKWQYFLAEEGPDSDDDVPSGALFDSGKISSDLIACSVLTTIPADTTKTFYFYAKDHYNSQSDIETITMAIMGVKR